MKYFVLFIFILSVACTSTVSKVIYSKKMDKTIAINFTEPKYQVNIDKMDNEKFIKDIDFEKINVFNSKKIILDNEIESKYLFEIIKFDYKVEKSKKEARSYINGQGTGNYGTQLDITLTIEAKISDKKTGEFKLISAGVQDIKTVSTDLLFNFFASDSESYSTIIEPINSSFLKLSNDVVKFIKKQKKIR